MLCLVEKQQIPTLYSLVQLNLGSNPQFTTLEAGGLVTTSPSSSFLNSYRAPTTFKLEGEVTSLSESSPGEVGRQQREVNCD